MRTFGARAVAFVLAVLFLTYPSLTVSVESDLRQGKSLAFLAAHPGDEMFIAPLWADLCLEPGRGCHITTITNGENGPCLLGAKCDTPAELALVRAREHRETAALLGSTVSILGMYPDLFNVEYSMWDSLALWVDLAGGELWIVVYQVVVDWWSRGVDRVVLFDYRHGSTCQSEHEAAGLLGLLAASMMQIPPENIHIVQTRYLPELRKGRRFEWYGYQAPVEDPLIELYDAQVSRPWLDDTAWSYLPAVVKIHASQFERRYVEALAEAEPEDQVVPMMRLSDLDTTDPDYWQICPILGY